jgi:hypothetical protein
MSIKTVKSIKQQKINSASVPNIMEAAKAWKPTASKPGRKSVLSTHIDTIRYLRGARKMTYKNITEFFNANGVKVSYPNLINFVTKNKIGGGAKKTKKTV